MGNEDSEKGKKDTSQMLESIILSITIILQYLDNTRFNVPEAESQRVPLIQYLYNVQGFLSQNKPRFNSYSDQDYLSQKYYELYQHLQSARGLFPQRYTVKTDASGRKITDWDFFVALRTKARYSVEPIIVDLNDHINEKKF